jgi:UDP-GlcNAc:undecaprenyl-phosphate/decaprenyl-phosphate GlcNAc-1-phosphate transferase
MLTELELRLAVALVCALVGFYACHHLPRVLTRLGLERRNFLGAPIGSAGGLLFVLGALYGVIRFKQDHRVMAGCVLAFGLLGLIDDRWGGHSHKGLRGHLAALQQGWITTGLVKALGGGAAALAAAWLLWPGPWALLSAALIALSANTLNLLDLRPLRALKLFWLVGLPAFTSAPPLLVFLLGLSLPYGLLEARRKVMLGDTGSNALGAALGATGAWILPLWAQGALVAALVLFHAWAERHSLTEWIDAHPWAKAIDRWGWNPEG